MRRDSSKVIKGVDGAMNPWPSKWLFHLVERGKEKLQRTEDEGRQKNELNKQWGKWEQEGKEVLEKPSLYIVTRLPHSREAGPVPCLVAT